MLDLLDDESFMVFATASYENPHCSGIDEFQDDLDRLKYVRRLLRKYDKEGVLRERLIINHLIVLTNVFGVKPAVRMLFFKVDRENHSDLKTFLQALSFLPDSIPEVDVGGIPLNARLLRELRVIGCE